jgi:dihydroflavonol-4-reductase
MPLGVKLVSGDVGIPESLAAAVDCVDCVYHLAGRTHAWSREEFLQANQQGTENLIQACARRENQPTVVVVSSLAAAGPAAASSPKREHEPDSPVSHYGHSKLAGEQAARKFAGQLPISIVRPPVVFGPGDRDGLVMFRGIRRMGMHVVLRGHELPLSLISSSDLATALLLVGERGERLAPEGEKGQGVYYAADPQVVPYAAMGRLVAEAMERRVRILKLRKWAFAAAASWGEVAGRIRRKPALVGFDKLREATACGWVCSAEKIQKQLGFAPAMTLDERYRETVEWYRAEGWL